MLCHNSNTTLQSIFSNFIPHKDTCIKAFKVSNFNEACKWLLIAFCFENPLSQIVMLKGMTSIFCQSFMRCGQLVYQLVDDPQNYLASYNNLFSHSCLKVSTNSSNSIFTCIVVNLRQSKIYDQSLQPLLWHRYTNFLITWIIIWAEEFWCIENMQNIKPLIRAIHVCLQIYDMS